MVDPINITDALEQTLRLLEAGDMDRAAAFLTELHPADSAEIIAELEPEMQAALTARLEPLELAEIFEQLDEEEMAEVAEHLDTTTLADVLDNMEPDTAADLLGELPPAERAELLQEMEYPEDVQTLLGYPEDTAGGIMNSAPPSLRRWMTVAEAVRFIKGNYASEDELYYLYVLDRFGALIGVVSLRGLILAEPEQTVEEIMNRSVITVDATADQEEVARLLSRYDLLALPVVDERQRLIGIVSVDDVVDVIEEEATEDIYHLAQVGAEAEILSPISQSVRTRLPWLVVNLGTAALAASVVSLFESTIAQAAVLATFMPIVAGQGGNAGTQTMTVVVRSLALGEIDRRDFLPALWHEIRIGLINGLTLGLGMALISLLWKGNPWLGLVVGVAMFGNMLVAAVAGVLAPMLLKALRVDPAVASSVFVTTATDMLGFFMFLGLASRLLPHLI